MGIPGEENPKETPGYSTERKEAVLKMLPLNLKTILQVCKLSGRDEFRGCPAQLVKSDPAVRSFAPRGTAPCKGGARRTTAGDGSTPSSGQYTVTTEERQAPKAMHGNQPGV